MRFVIQILVNALAIFVAARLVPGFIFEGDLISFLIAGSVLGLINIFVKPIVRLVSAPLIALSLGLFLIVINIALLWLLEYLVPELTISGFWAYFWGVFLISLVNMAFHAKRKKKD